MAHLNRERNVNDPWVMNNFVNHATSDVEVDVYCSDFRLRISFPYHRESTMSQVHCIAVAEYLWAPGQQLSLTLEQAQQTYEYLEATRG